MRSPRHRYGLYATVFYSIALVTVLYRMAVRGLKAVLI